MFTLTVIPDVVIAPLGLHVIEDGCIAAPEMCMYVKKTKETKTSFVISHKTSG